MALSFINGTTVTPAEFKAAHKVTDLKFAFNETTGRRCFLADGIVRGACTKDHEPKDPVISRVVGDDGEPFYLVHEKPQYQNLTVGASF